jgi:hypothetical protein
LKKKNKEEGRTSKKDEVKTDKKGGKKDLWKERGVL